MRPARNAAQGSSPLERVLPIMLQGNHLASRERLACFQTSKGTSDAVLRHASCTHLMLSLGPSTPAGGSGSSSRRNARAHAAAAQELAARSHEVTLTLRGGLLTPAACLQQRITTLELHDMQLEQHSSAQLQLHTLPRLHTLILVRCRTVTNSSTSSSSKQQSNQKYRSSSVRTLVWSTEPNGSFPADFLELVDLSQLQKLTIDSTSITSLLPQLPALKELHMLSKGHLFKHTAVPQHSYINDVGLHQLLAHEQLARVSWPRTFVCCSPCKPCTWESLQLLGGAELADFCFMPPLAGVQSCTVHGRMMTFMKGPEGPDYARSGIDSISSASNIVFQADSGNTACNWVPAEPSFALELEDVDHPQTCADIITMTMQRLAPGTALVIRDLTEVDASVVLNSLATAPTTLTTLSFNEAVFSKVFHLEVVPGVLTYLPVHVSHVLLEMPRFPLALRLLSKLLLPFVGGLARPLQLTLLVRDLGPWEAMGQGVIEGWLASVTSGDVQLQLQLVEDDEEEY